MSTELYKLLDDGAQMLSSFLPAELRTLLNAGAQQFSPLIEKNLMGSPLGWLLVAAVWVQGLAMIGVIMGSATPSVKKQ